MALFKDDISLFAKFFFGIELNSRQIEFAEAFRTNRQIALRGGAGFAKNKVVGLLVWWSLICFDEVQVTIFGPNELAIKHGIWKSICELYDKLDPAIKREFHVGSRSIARRKKPSDCFAEFRLANKDNISSARGIHQKNNFVFVDEANRVDDEVFTDALINILNDKNPKLCLIDDYIGEDGFYCRTWKDEAISDEWKKVSCKYPVFDIDICHKDDGLIG